MTFFKRQRERGRVLKHYGMEVSDWAESRALAPRFFETGKD